VCEIDKTQQQMSNQIDISAQILERVVKDQAMLARQLDATSQAAARLTLDRPPVEEVPLPSRPSVCKPQMGDWVQMRILMGTHIILVLKVDMLGTTCFNSICLRCLFQGLWGESKDLER
jgi:hypothetical protein